MRLRRLVARYVRFEDAFVPVAFFLIVVSLSVFGAGPDLDTLVQIGPGTLWTAALLAFLLPVGTIFARDLEAGVLDQLRVGGLAFETIAAARILGLYISVALPLLAACALASLLMPGGTALLGPAFPVGFLALAALAVAAGGLIAGARGGEALAGLLILPLALPILIFGAGGEFRLLLAATLVLVVTAPFAAAAALRAAEA